MYCIIYYIVLIVCHSLSNIIKNKSYYCNDIDIGKVTGMLWLHLMTKIYSKGSTLYNT